MTQKVTKLFFAIFLLWSVDCFGEADMAQGIQSVTKTKLISVCTRSVKRGGMAAGEAAGLCEETFMDLEATLAMEGPDQVAAMAYQDCMFRYKRAMGRAQAHAACHGLKSFLSLRNINKMKIIKMQVNNSDARVVSSETLAK